jgi:hypothetical protein
VIVDCIQVSTPFSQLMQIVSERLSYAFVSILLLYNTYLLYAVIYATGSGNFHA